MRSSAHYSRRSGGGAAPVSSHAGGSKVVFRCLTLCSVCAIVVAAIVLVYAQLKMLFLLPAQTEASSISDARAASFSSSSTSTLASSEIDEPLLVQLSTAAPASAAAASAPSAHETLSERIVRKSREFRESRDRSRRARIVSAHSPPTPLLTSLLSAATPPPAASSVTLPDRMDVLHAPTPSVIELNMPRAWDDAALAYKSLEFRQHETVKAAAWQQPHLEPSVMPAEKLGVSYRRELCDYMYVCALALNLWICGFSSLFFFVVLTCRLSSALDNATTGLETALQSASTCVYHRTGPSLDQTRRLISMAQTP